MITISRFGVPDKTQADVQRYCFQEAVNPSHAGEMQVSSLEQ